ncbi:MAG TPA: trehalase-like domain-containing protein [Kofleriaceae bacterium]
MRIEDYALLGDTQTIALVGRTGSVDWLCFPRFDSGACFAALLGTPEHGRWLIAPRGELRRVERRYRDELVRDGFVHRYRTGPGPNLDGLPGGEGAFLACSFWLVDALVLAGRGDEAGALFDRLLAVRNDVGLLSEEYDTGRRRLVGNFPQAFSDVALVNSARNRSSPPGPAHHRAQRCGRAP